MSTTPEVENRRYLGLEVEEFTHLSGPSRYNHNYHLTKDGGALLYAKSNDLDGTTEWYLINRDLRPSLIGYSHMSQEPEILVAYD